MNAGVSSRVSWQQKGASDLVWCTSHVARGVRKWSLSGGRIACTPSGIGGGTEAAHGRPLSQESWGGWFGASQGTSGSFSFFPPLMQFLLVKHPKRTGARGGRREDVQGGAASAPRYCSVSEMKPVFASSVMRMGGDLRCCVDHDYKSVVDGFPVVRESLGLLFGFSTRLSSLRFSLAVAVLHYSRVFVHFRSMATIGVAPLSVYVSVFAL